MLFLVASRDASADQIYAPAPPTLKQNLRSTCPPAMDSFCIQVAIAFIIVVQ